MPIADAYSAEEVLLNKWQIWSGAPKLDYYRQIVQSASLTLVTVYFRCVTIDLSLIQ